MSLATEADEAVDPGHAAAGCLICCTTHMPLAAYRPHTLDDDCWCTRNNTGKRIIARCWLAKQYGL
jgi:hypothetical protein